MISYTGLFYVIIIHYEEEDTANREKADHGSSALWLSVWLWNLICLAFELDGCSVNLTVPYCLYTDICIHTLLLLCV